MPIIGKVLWWDRRDQEGIIVDGVGNQYYFNKSVLGSTSTAALKDGVLVEFQPSNTVPDVSCAAGVRVLTARQQQRANSIFENGPTLDLDGGV